MAISNVAVIAPALMVGPLFKKVSGKIRKHAEVVEDEEEDAKMIESELDDSENPDKRPWENVKDKISGMWMIRNPQDRELLTSGNLLLHYNASLNEFHDDKKPKTQKEIDKEEVSNKEYWDAFYKDLSKTPRFEDFNELFDPDVHVKKEVVNI